MIELSELNLRPLESPTYLRNYHKVCTKTHVSNLKFGTSPCACYLQRIETRLSKMSLNVCNCYKY